MQVGMFLRHPSFHECHQMLLHCWLCYSVAGSPQNDECEDAGPSEGPHVAQQSARPKSKYNSAGFVGFWASQWAHEDFRRPLPAELMGRQPGQDGSRVVNCSLDFATGMHVAALVCKFLQLQKTLHSAANYTRCLDLFCFMCTQVRSYVRKTRWRLQRSTNSLEKSLLGRVATIRATIALQPTCEPLSAASTWTPPSRRGCMAWIRMLRYSQTVAISW